METWRKRAGKLKDDWDWRLLLAQARQALHTKLRGAFRDSGDEMLRPKQEIEVHC